MPESVRYTYLVIVSHVRLYLLQIRSLLWPALPVILLLAGCQSTPTDPAAGGRVAVHLQPFEVRGQQEGAEYLGKAFTGSLIANLKQADELEIIDSAEAADSLLTGTLTRDGQAVRACVQLHDSGKGELLWEAAVSSGEGDLSRLASVLAGKIWRYLELPDLDLYQFIGSVRGGAEMSSSPLISCVPDSWYHFDLHAFLSCSSDLVAEFGEDPDAHVLHAWGLTHLWAKAPTLETLSRLKETLAELNRLDPQSPYDELLRAFIYRSSGNPDWSRELYSRVLARTDLAIAARSWVLRQRSLTYLQVGNTAAALADAEHAVKLDPAGASGLLALSKTLETMGQIEEAISRSKQALLLEPFAWRQHQRLGLVYTRAGRFDEAVKSLKQACRLGRAQEACANLAVALQRGGRVSEARRSAEHAASLAGSQWGLYNLACYQARSGEKKAALVSLQEAVTLGFADVLVNTDPDLDALRGDPEFDRIAGEIENRLRSRRQVSESVFPWQA